MKLTIKKGEHYDDNLFSTWPHIAQKLFKKIVTFDKTCEYELPVYSQGNVNKLFGGYFGLFAEHKNSVRFGWRWSFADKKIELLAYVYDAGKRNWDEQMRFPVVAQIDLDETVECSICVMPDSYVFEVKKDGKFVGEPVVVPHDRIPSWGFTQSLYFGGAEPAPHDMSVFM